MKKSKILAILLCVAILATQFAMLGGVSAETATYEALTGREEFLVGVNIHHMVNTPAYNETYSAISDAENLGSNILRINGTPSDEAGYSYFKSVGDIAADKGMQVMLANVGFVNYVTITEEVDGKNVTRPRTVDELDLEAITTYYSELATSLKGSVKYYQLGNEMDNSFYTGGGFGRTYDTNYKDVTVAAIAIDTAVKAIREADSDAKVIVNFVSQHVGFIHGLKTVDIDSTTEGIQTASWDYIGMDWYSNMLNADSVNPDDGEPYDYADNINDLSVYDEQIIVCETNLTPESWNEEDHSQISYIGDASWLADFATYCYNNSDVAGFIAYELWDEPALESNDVFNKEAHYGLIDKDGNKKETYNVLQALYGGTDVARATITAPNNTKTVGEVVNTAFDTVKETEIKRYFNDLAAENSDFYKTVFSSGDFEATDFSTADMIEFDLYVEDVDALNAAMDNAGLELRVILNGNGSYRDARNVQSHKIKNDGWNHIVLSKRNFAHGGEPWAAIESMSIGYYGTNASNNTNRYLNAASGMKLAVANLCATKLTKTTESTVGDVAFTAGTSYVGRFGNNNGYFFELYDQFKQKGAIPSGTATATEYYEFDIYIDDYEALLESLENDTYQNLGLYFCVSSYNSTDFAGRNCLRWNITNLIKGDGWNHIVLARNDGNQSNKNAVAPWVVNKPAGANLCSYSLAFIDNNGTMDTKGEDDTVLTSSNAATIGGAAGFDMFAMTNVIGTNFVAPTADPVATPVVTLPTEMKKAKIGGQFNYTGDNTKVTGIEATSFSNAEYIEFDFFVESYAALKKEMDAKGPTNMTLRISSNATNPYNNSIALTFFDQVKHSGWNHIILPKVTPSACDETAIVSYYVIFNGTINTTNTYSDMQIAIANIQGTSLVKPDMDNVGISEIAIYEDMYDVNIGSDFRTAIPVVLDNTVNAKFGANNPTYIEFDFFVQDYEDFISASANNSLNLRISSSTESYDLHSFSTVNIQQYITKSGWNHVQIPFSEFGKNVAGGTSGTFDAASINRFRFYFGGNAKNSSGAAQDMKIAVANLAATADMIIPDDIMPENNPIIEGVTNITVEGDGTYTIDLSEAPKDISGDNLFEMDVFVTGDALESLTVMFVDSSTEKTASYTFVELTAGWNHLALRLDDFDYAEGFDKTQITSCYILSDAGANIYVANFYTATYVKGDGNRDGETNIMDLIRMKKYTLGIDNPNGSAGNTVAMDVYGDDYLVNAQDLTALTRYMLFAEWN